VAVKTDFNNLNNSYSDNCIKPTLWDFCGAKFYVSWL